jgi:hypothetical protein
MKAARPAAKKGKARGDSDDWGSDDSD